MSVHESFKRYYLIIQLIKEGRYPSKEKIIEMLVFNKLLKSNRTINRDIDKIRHELGIEIVYDKAANGYYIDLEESPDLESMLRILELSNSAGMMIDTIKKGKNISQHLLFDGSERLAGVEQLQRLLTAIEQQQVIAFDYFNFQKHVNTHHTVYPYLLKECDNRWFLYGENEKHMSFSIYGIERISNLKIINSHYTARTDRDPSHDFDHVIGITLRPFIENQSVQDIVLSMSQEQGNYYKSLPWHPRYEVLQDDEGTFRIRLHLLPNYELLKILLSYCDKITVEEPEWLRKHIKKVLVESSKKY